MMRWFWRVWTPIALLVVLYPLALAIGPQVELWASPIRVHDVISDVQRTPENWLCWRWQSVKLRAADFRLLDAFIDRGDGDESFPEVFNRSTRKPWHKNGALPLGPSDVSFCVQLPPDAPATERIVVRQALHYRGFLGLWDLVIRLPDAVSPGTITPGA